MQVPVDAAMIEQVLSAMERHPFATLSLIMLAGLCLGLAIVLRRRT